MDYEKKYNEALERAKKYHTPDSNNSNLKAVLEQIFPQLCESEDERIRKEIIEYLTVTREIDLVGHPERQRWITYLEKQKEQNGEDEECTDFTIYHPLKNGKGEYECIPYSFYGSLTSFSEDKDLIDFLRTCFYTEEECNEWIKQKKEQKPAGWSEEDEKRIQRICDFLWKNRRGDTDTIYQIEKDADWLKSLRPSWKPSEEQMNCLCNAVDAAIRKHNESISGYKPARVLKSLYEQLKKL